MSNFFLIAKMTIELLRVVWQQKATKCDINYFFFSFKDFSFFLSRKEILYKSIFCQNYW